MDPGKNFGFCGYVSACSGKSSDKAAATDDGSLVPGGRVVGAQTFTPSTQKTATVRYEPGADAQISLWRSQLTVPDGWLAQAATIVMKIVPGGVVANRDLAPLSPLLAFDAAFDGGTAVARTDAKRSLQLVTVVDRSLDPLSTVGLIILGQGTAAEQRFVLRPADIKLTALSDGSTSVAFPTRDTAFAFAVAATTKGRIPAGYSAYPSVPPDNEDLAASLTGVDDEPTGVRLTWTPAAGTRSAYRLSVSDGATYPGDGCADGAKLDPAAITSERTTFPVQSSKDHTQVTGLTAGALVKFRLCSLNDRDPADASDGIEVEYQLPARALAVLTDTPAAHSNAAALATTVGGTGLTDYRYALTASVDDCAAATYSDWLAATTAISDVVADGPRTICVLGRNGPKNLQIVATAYAWVQDRTPPGAFAIDAVPTPSNTTAPLLAWAAADGASSYRVVIASDALCATTVQFADVASPSFQASALADGVYHLCVTATDLAGNQTAASNTALAFEVDTGAPVFTSMPLAHEAADAWLNASELSLTGTLAGPLTGSGYDSAGYALALQATACDAALTYAATVPQSNNAGLTAEAGYKVCVRLADAAGNVSFGASPAFQRKATGPAFTSVALANAAVDTYINAADHVLTTALVGAAVGTGHDAAAYAVVDAATTCNGSVTYGALPLANAAALTAEGSYKVCVKLTDLALNPPAYGASSPFTYDHTPPAFTALALANGAADGYVNAADHATSTAIGGALTAEAGATAAYRLEAAATTCTTGLAYGAMPLLNSTTFSGNGAYKICVRLTDAAGNAAAYASSAITLDLTAPSFSALSLANTAADGYVNAAERGAATALVSAATGSGFDTAAYAVAASAASCVGLTYSASLPLANDAGLAVDGAYKVCVELSDDAGNTPAYGASATFIVDTIAPTLSSVTSTTPNGAYGAGEAIGLELLFDEAIIVAGGTPTLKLETGATDHAAVYSGNVNATTLGFTYTVQAGDSSADLATHATAPQLALGGGTIKDAAGNAVALDVSGATSLASGASLVIDTTAPAAFNILAPSGTVSDNTPTASWSDPTDAATFAVKVDTVSGCPAPLQTYAAVSGLTQTLTALAPGAYYICVTARDAAGNTTAASNDNLNFTVGTGTWASLATSGAPVDRQGARAVWDSVDGQALIWGGVAGATYLGDGGMFDPSGNAWSAIDASDGDRPAGRIDFSAVWAATQMIVWGGFDGSSVVDSGGRYVPNAGDPWLTVASSGAPSARRGHTAVWDDVRGRMIIFGGFDGASAVDDGAAYDPVGDAWTALDVSEPDHAAARSQHTAVWTGSKMIVWGGLSGATALASGAVYDPVGATGDVWVNVTTSGAPTARYGHVAFWDPLASVMVVYGGHAQGGAALADGAFYDPVGDVWTAFTATDAPAARFDAAAVWDSVGHRLLVSGGDSGGAALAGGAAFSVSGNAWTVPVLSPVGAPGARYGAAAVWTGSKMVVFGGFDGTGLAAGGAMLTPP